MSFHAKEVVIMTKTNIMNLSLISQLSTRDYRIIISETKLLRRMKNE